MLNLDLLGGVNFEKGCYTGQEIIARTHFRGAIKRRMFRFECAGPPPAPGTRVLAGEQHAGEVVDAATSGRAARGDQSRAAGCGAAAGAVAQLQKLPLPYAVAIVG